MATILERNPELQFQHTVNMDSVSYRLLTHVPKFKCFRVVSPKGKKEEECFDLIKHGGISKASSIWFPFKYSDDTEKSFCILGKNEILIMALLLRYVIVPFCFARKDKCLKTFLSSRSEQSLCKHRGQCLYTSWQMHLCLFLLPPSEWALSVWCHLDMLSPLPMCPFPLYWTHRIWFVFYPM